MSDPQADTVPKGFEILTESDPDCLTILHRRTGMRTMNIFLVGWVTAWTVFCIVFTCEYISGIVSASSDRPPLLLVGIFWVADFFVGYWMIYCLFAIRLYLLGPHELVLVTKVLYFRNERIIPLSSIRYFSQVKDGGEDEDSFPSWGLVLEAYQKITLLYRQDYEKSHWLGELLANWAGVKFFAEDAPEV